MLTRRAEAELREDRDVVRWGGAEGKERRKLRQCVRIAVREWGSTQVKARTEMQASLKRTDRTKQEAGQGYGCWDRPT